MNLIYKHDNTDRMLNSNREFIIEHFTGFVIIVKMKCDHQIIRINDVEHTTL